MPSTGTAASHSAGRPWGVVYTPPQLAAFLVDRLLTDGRDASDERWLDPACGGGALLVEVVRHLAREVAAADLPRAVEAQVWGVDVDHAACAVSARAVSREVARFSGPQPADFFHRNVVNADFLDLAPDALGYFTQIVGNPPYVSATQLDLPDKTRYLTHFASAWGRLDLYALFIEQGLNFLGDAGTLAYITPDKYLTATSSARLRALIARRFSLRSIDRFERHDLFHGVATVPCITVIDRLMTRTARPPAARLRWWTTNPQGTVVRVSSREDRVQPRADGAPWQPSRPRRSTGSATLGSIVDRVSVGLATGLNACFVVPSALAASLEAEVLRPAVRGRDIRPGDFSDSRLMLLLPYRFDARGKATLIDLNEVPAVREHLLGHRPALERRHCVRVWSKRWYDLHDPVIMDLARRPKILVPDIAREPRFAFDPGRVVPLHSAYYLLPRSDGPLAPESLTAILNTPRLRAELRARAPTAKSGFRRFRAQFLRELSVPILTRLEQQRLAEGTAENLSELDERVGRTLESDAA